MAFSWNTTYRISVFLLAAGISACTSQNKKTTNEFVNEADLLNSESIGIDDLKNTNEDSLDLSQIETSSTTLSSDESLVTQTVIQTNNNTQSAYRLSTFPKVSNTPFEKDGFLMNAFYIVQSDQENYSTLSQLFYGRPERAEMIKSWNNSIDVQAGSVVYYNSHFRYKDASNMVNFYDDYGFSWDNYTVKAGDTLSKIAYRLYNNTNTWRNLAAYNTELQSPDILEIGQNLRIPRLDIDTESKRLEAQALAQQQNQEQAAAKQPNAEIVNSAANVQASQIDQTEQSIQQEELPQANAPPEEATQFNSDDEISAEDLNEESKGLANIEGTLKNTTNSTSKQRRLLFAGIALVIFALLLVIIRRRLAKKSA